MTEYGDDDTDEIVDSGSLREIMKTSDAVVNHDWTMKKSGNIRVTLDGARSFAWTKAKVEFRFVRGKIRNHLGRHRGSFILPLIDLIYGPHSEIWASFSRNIDVSHDKFIRFLGVFFMGCCHNKSCAQIYSEHSLLRAHAENLLEKAEYIEIWDLVSKASLPLQIGKTAFWIEIQSAFNASCRKLFIEGSNDIDLDIVVDDDKVIYETKKSESDGLKVVRHVNDNRNGHVFHTAAFTYSGLVIGVEAERSQDDTTGSATKRLLMGQLRPSHGTFGSPDLTNIRLHSDRAYWSDDLEEFILSSGADVGAGTRKRYKGFPFTFEQSLSSNDPRLEIPTAGFKRLFIKTRKHLGRDVTAVAYRNNGNVTLGMSTIFSDHEWDLVLENPSDKEYVHDPDWKFRSLLKTALIDFESGSDDIKQLLNSLDVEFITTNQNSPGWFLLRSFAITSSAADGLIDELYQDFQRRQLPATLSSNSQRIFRYFCKNMGHSTNREDTDSDSDRSDDDSSDSNDSGREEEKDEGKEEEKDEEVSFDINAIARNIASWNRGESTATMVAVLEDETAMKRVNNQLLSQYVREMGGNPKQAKTSNKGDILAWLKASHNVRPYVFMSNKDLKTLLAERGDRSKSYNGVTREALIRELTGGVDEQDGGARKELWKRLIGRILKATFMPKLVGKGKEYAKIGHKMETPLLNELLHHPDNPYRILQIVRPGLVAKSGERYIKTSVDAIGMMDKVGGPELIGIEIKVRATSATRQDELERRREISDDVIFTEYEIDGLDERYGFSFKVVIKQSAYILFSCSLLFYFLYSVHIKDCIDSKHELIHILHHAYVYNFKIVLLLVGDKSGSILRGVYITFPGSLKTAYGNMMQSIYLMCLKWAYALNDPLPEEVIKEELQQVIGDVDCDSFLDHFKIWKYVNDRIPQPLPPLQRLIPRVFSTWNSMKGGSDTTTKLLCQVKEGNLVPRYSSQVCCLCHQ